MSLSMSSPEALPILSPSLLAADFTQLAAAVRLVEDCEAAWLHLDVMDGHFVPNLTFGAPLIAALRPLTSLIFDVHLMVQNPDDTLKWYLDAGATMLVVHLEAAHDIKKMGEYVHAHNCRFGVALCPDTPVETLRNYLPDLDMVLLMSVHPGFAGQSFIEATIPKLHALSALCTELDVHPLIQVDGGINADTAARTAAAGAQVFVAGNAVFKAANPVAAAADIIAQAKGALYVR